MHNPVGLRGTTEGRVQVVHVQTGSATVSDALGQFSFDEVSLVLGANALTIQAIDEAGNTAQFMRTITLLSPSTPLVQFDDPDLAAAPNYPNVQRKSVQAAVF